MFKKALIAAVTAALVAVASGCNTETPTAQTGDLQVTLRVGSGSSTCADVGIAFFRVYIDISETETLIDQIFACEPDNQSITFIDVDVGTYTVRVEGLDGDNGVIYGGQTSEPIVVGADRTNGPVNVILDQLRPSMEIFFGFSDVGGCDRFEVIDFVVLVYENGASSIYDQSLDCATQITDSLIIDDLSDSSIYDLRIRGTNDNGEYTYEYNADGIVTEPGAPTVVSAELTPCTGLCSPP